MIVLKIILAFLLSPLAAFLQVGTSKHFWINLVLYLISFSILGIIHALWLILTDQKEA